MAKSVAKSVKLKTPKIPKTTILSTRLPVDIANAWKGEAKASGKSVAELMRDKVSNVNTPNIKFSEGGLVQDVPKDVEKAIMAIGGGYIVGLLAYKGVHNALKSSQNNGRLQLTDMEIEVISGALGLAGALVVSMGILNAVNSKQSS